MKQNKTKAGAKKYAPAFIFLTFGTIYQIMLTEENVHDIGEK